MTAPLAPGTKTARQARITAILGREQVHSQEQLAGLLGQYAGLRVTQATLSRDLDELGVVRLRGADGTLVYALPGDPGGPGSPPGTTFDYPERGRLTPAPPVPLPAGESAPAGGPAPAARGAASTAQLAATATGTPATGTSGTGTTATGTTATGTSGTGTTATGTTATGTTATGTTATGTTETAGTRATGTGAAGLDQAVPDRTRPRTTVSASGGSVSPRLVRYLKELLTSAEASANLVVLRTPAGAAQFLASAIDHAAWPAILGTVAGDDTVLVIARDPVGGDALADDFRRLAERRR